MTPATAERGIRLARFMEGTEAATSNNDTDVRRYEFRSAAASNCFSPPRIGTVAFMKEGN